MYAVAAGFYRFRFTQDRCGWYEADSSFCAFGDRVPATPANISSPQYLSTQSRSDVVIRPQALYVGINAREEQSVFLRVSTRFCAALFDSSLSQQLCYTHTRALKRRVPHNNNINLCTGSSLRNESFFETQWTPALHTRARMHAGRGGLWRVYTAYDMIAQHVRCAVALTFSEFFFFVDESLKHRGSRFRTSQDGQDDQDEAVVRHYGPCTTGGRQIQLPAWAFVCPRFSTGGFDHLLHLCFAAHRLSVLISSPAFE